MSEGNWGRPYIPRSFWDDQGIRFGDYLLVAHTPTEDELKGWESLSPDEAAFVLDDLVGEGDFFFFSDVARLYGAQFGYFDLQVSQSTLIEWLRLEIKPFMGSLTLLRERAISGPPLVPLTVPLGFVEPEEEKDWLELFVVDRWGRPVPGLGYEVRCANGRVISGKLDKEGHAEHRDVEPGEAEVRFLNVHPDEWRLRGASGDGWPNPTVDLALADADGLPLADTAFTLEFETGEQLDGQTDAAGKAALTDTPLGPYAISFPDYPLEDFK